MRARIALSVANTPDEVRTVWLNTFAEPGEPFLETTADVWSILTIHSVHIVYAPRVRITAIELRI
jgi:hypothetical protein